MGAEEQMIWRVNYATKDIKESTNWCCEGVTESSIDGGGCRGIQNAIR
jgi:hypothetical protein